MDPKPIIGAVLGAILGAAIWAAISYFIGYEVGYIAWGVGGLVGGGSFVMGGGGRSVGTVCALLAVGAIFAGKMLAVQMAIFGETSAFVDENTTRQIYESEIGEAAQFSVLKTNVEFKEFMVEFSYVDATSPEYVTKADLDDFKLYNLTALRDFHENVPSYDDWRDERDDMLRAFVGESTSVTGIVLDNLSWMDFLFAFLGIATAFRIGGMDELGAA